MIFSQIYKALIRMRIFRHLSKSSRLQQQVPFAFLFSMVRKAISFTFSSGSPTSRSTSPACTHLSNKREAEMAMALCLIKQLLSSFLQVALRQSREQFLVDMSRDQDQNTRARAPKKEAI